MKEKEAKIFREWCDGIADAIRKKRYIDDEIVALNFREEILKILDVYSSEGISYVLLEDPLILNKLQIGQYPKKKFNGYQICDYINFEIKEEINTKDYLLLNDALSINLEEVEEVEDEF